MPCKICHSIQPDKSGFKHICIPTTCSNCFSPKEVFESLCLTCRKATPCFFCTKKSVYTYETVRVCPNHLDLSCQLEADMRKEDFNDFRQDYEKICLLQKKRRNAHIRRRYKKKKQELYECYLSQQK